jgi:hypothetical protein
MIERSGDLWDRFGKSFLVIPTNIGWKAFHGKTGRPGPNVMGKGVALAAAEKVPGLPQLYGEYCALKGADTDVTFDLSTGLVLFPTKPLNIDNPGVSWKAKASLELIERSARQLKELSDLKLLSRAALNKNDDNAAKLEDEDVYLPYVGCGAGELEPALVLPILRSILTDDRFILVRYFPF